MIFKEAGQYLLNLVNWSVVIFCGFWRGLMACADWIAKLSGAAVVLFAILLFFNEQISTKVKIGLSERFGVTGAVKYLIADEYDVEGLFVERKPWKLGQLYLIDDDPMANRDWELLEKGAVLQTKSEQHIRLLNGCQDEKNEDCATSPRIFTLQTGQCVIFLERLYTDIKKERVWRRKPNKEELANGAAATPFVEAKNPSGGWLKVATTTCEIFN